MLTFLWYRMCTFSKEHEKILENLGSLCSKLVKEHEMREKAAQHHLSQSTVSTVGDITRVHQGPPLENSASHRKHINASLKH